MTKNNKAFNIYFLIMLGILLVMIWYTSWGASENNYTKGAFLNDLNAGNVTQVVIQPNAETPTGVISVEKKGGGTNVLYVTNVDEIRTLLAQ